MTAADQALARREHEVPETTLDAPLGEENAQVRWGAPPGT